MVSLTRLNRFGSALLLIMGGGLISPAALQASELVTPWPGKASQPIPSPWVAQYHPKIPQHTEFKLVQTGSAVALEAAANKAYGTLVHPFSRPVELDTLSWEWQVLTHPTGANLKTKAGDDAGAKLCVFVQIDEGKLGLGTRLAMAAARTLSGEDLPAATLCYVWGLPGERAGQVFDNPYTDRVRNIVLRDLPGSNELLSEQRDVQADARLAFGDELPKGAVRFTGLALGSDSDNTGSIAKARFGSIRAQ